MEKKNEKIDLRTPFQKKRDEMQAGIIADFKAMYKSAPDTPPWRIINILATRYCYSEVGVFHLLKRKGIYRSHAGKAIITIDD